MMRIMTPLTWTGSNFWPVETFNFERCCCSS
jgi:hypothetical protein